MVTSAVETSDLTHHFGRDPVLHGIDLSVPVGAIYGFLGPNGAGKTTTLRLLLGLLRRQRGTVRIFGRPLERDRIEILRRVGSSIETPSIYGQLTAAENLEVWRRLFRCERRRIDEVLRLVGLDGTGAKRADRFSLGMKQRLAMAIALLHEPALLVLDEPTNGLDPHGVIQVRRLLGALNRERGITIIVSSHVLSEVERLVTDVGIIHQGRMRFQGTLDSLRARQRATAATLVETSDNGAVLGVAREHGFAARLEGAAVAIPGLSRDDAARLVASIAGAGIAVYQVTCTTVDLERIFLDLVGGAA